MNTQPKPTREELDKLIVAHADCPDFVYAAIELNEALDRLYATDWVKIEEGGVMPEVGRLVETHGKYGRDVFMYQADGFNVEFDFGGPVQTHWRYATPPPDETI
jgi:hypothetical protein